MKCPKCGMEMKIRRRDVSNNSDNGKTYNRVINVCEMCDVWVTVELPIEK